jgi:glycosyltransferase involved in cell wall biosynthesis
MSLYKENITVLMTTYNSADTIKEAIESVLNQTYKYFELLIIDDGSKDETESIIKSFSDKRIVFYKIGHVGRGGALNFGLKISKYDYIAIMDADDIASPYRLEEQIKFLKKNFGISIVGSYAELIDKNRNHISTFVKPIQHNKIYKNLFAMNSISFGTVLFKKDISQKYFFNENLMVAEDLEWFQRVLTKYRANNIPKILMSLRQAENSRSRRADIEYSRLLETVYSNVIQLNNSNKGDFFINFFHLGCLHYYYGDLNKSKEFFLKALKYRKNDPILYRYLLPLYLFNVKRMRKFKTAKYFADLYRKLFP